MNLLPGERDPDLHTPRPKPDTLREVRGSVGLTHGSMNDHVMRAKECGRRDAEAKLGALMLDLRARLDDQATEIERLRALVREMGGTP